MKGIVGHQVVSLLINTLLTKENIIKALDYILDQMEEYAAGTDNKLDDAAVKVIRDALNIPDNDPPAIP